MASSSMTPSSTSIDATTSRAVPLAVMTMPSLLTCAAASMSCRSSGGDSRRRVYSSTACASCASFSMLNHDRRAAGICCTQLFTLTVTFTFTRVLQAVARTEIRAAGDRCPRPRGYAAVGSAPGAGAQLYRGPHAHAVRTCCQIQGCTGALPARCDGDVESGG